MDNYKELQTSEVMENTKDFIRMNKFVVRVSPATRNSVSSDIYVDERISCTDDEPDLGHVAEKLCNMK